MRLLLWALRPNMLCCTHLLRLHASCWQTAGLSQQRRITGIAVCVLRLRCGCRRFDRMVALSQLRVLLHMSVQERVVRRRRSMVPYHLNDGALGTGRWACQSFWKLGKTATAWGEEALKGGSPSTLDRPRHCVIGSNWGREPQARHAVSAAI